MYQPIFGTFLRRYKRFLVDILLDNGEMITAHCTNTGSLKSCLIENAPVVVSKVNNTSRKTKYTWEMIKVRGTWVGVNTQRANEIAFELLKQNKIKGFENLKFLKREVKFDSSRFDIYAESDREKIFIEVKNVTYREGDSALFPDAETKRGQKHIEQLLEAKEKGFRVALFFIIQRDDVKLFKAADEIDPIYAKLLLKAYRNGVEILPIMVKAYPNGWDFVKILEFKV